MELCLIAVGDKEYSPCRDRTPLKRSGWEAHLWDSKLSVAAKDLPGHFCELAVHKAFSGIMFRVAELEEVPHIQAKLSVCVCIKEFNIEHRIKNKTGIKDN